MIKVNLAAKKKSKLLRESPEVGNGSESGFSEVHDQSLPLKKILTSFLICLVASQGLDYFQDFQVKRIELAIQATKRDLEKLQQESKKFASPELGQPQTDLNLSEMAAKLKSVQTLLNSRNEPAKIMTALSSAIPKEVWLTKVQVEQDRVMLSGSSLGFSQISEFIKNLHNYEVFKTVELTKSSQNQGFKGIDVTRFELKAMRKID